MGWHRIRAFVLVSSVWGLALDPGQAATITVSDKLSFAGKAGEAQSTVVGAGLKAECPAGRVLMSNDLRLRRLPIPTGTILGHDLDHLDGPETEAVVDKPVNPQYFTFGQDHDLVGLSNGDVLLFDMVSTLQPVDPKPIWFDRTFRDGKHDDYGPGARTGLMVWRSTDCGQNFHYVSVFDPATVGDRTCAFPQRPAETAHHPLDMGGSDGPFSFYAPGAGRLFAVFQCVGYRPDPSVKDAFVLSRQRLNETAVIESADEGSSWHFLGYFPKAGWRRSVVAPKQDRLVLDVGTGLAFGARDADGTFSYTAPAAMVPDLPRPSLDTEAGKELDATYGNLWGHTMLAQLPGHTRKFVLAVPNRIARQPGGAVQAGYRIFLYDGLKNVYAEIAPALPAAAAADDYLMHLGIINIGHGPLLIYWSEFDVPTRKGQVRGRLLFNETEYSSDFVIGRRSGAPAPWELKPNAHYWYGDYQTASGLERAGPPGAKTRTFEYYPIWIEPNGTVPFTRVTVTTALRDHDRIGAVGGPDGLSLVSLPPGAYSIVPRALRIADIPSTYDIGEQSDDDADKDGDRDDDDDRSMADPNK